MPDPPRLPLDLERDPPSWLPAAGELGLFLAFVAGVCLLSMAVAPPRGLLQAVQTSGVPQAPRLLRGSLVGLGLLLLLAPVAWQLWWRRRYARCAVFQDGVRFSPRAEDERERFVPLKQINAIRRLPGGLVLETAGMSRWSSWFAPWFIPVADDAEADLIVQVLTRLEPAAGGRSLTPGAPPRSLLGLVWLVTACASAALFFWIAGVGFLACLLIGTERLAFGALANSLVRTRGVNNGENHLHAALRVLPDAVLIGQRRISAASLQRVAFEDGFMALITRGDDYLLWVADRAEQVRARLLELAPHLQEDEALPAWAAWRSRRWRFLGSLLAYAVATSACLCVAWLFHQLMQSR